MTDLNANISECIVKMDGFLGVKVANVCTNTSEWIYYPAATIAGNAFMVLVLLFALAVLAMIVFNQ